MSAIQPRSQPPCRASMGKSGWPLRVSCSILAPSGRIFLRGVSSWVTLRVRFGLQGPTGGVGVGFELGSARAEHNPTQPSPSRPLEPSPTR
eukprot:8827277-Pyramimonas_sp.AAC.1